MPYRHRELPTTPSVTDHHPQQPPSRDTRGNVVGDITLADGTVESVDALGAWADAFEAADPAPPLSPPTTTDASPLSRRVRHAAIRTQLAAEEAQTGTDENAGAPAPTPCTRCDGQGRIRVPCPDFVPKKMRKGKLGPGCLVLHAGPCPDCAGTGVHGSTATSEGPQHPG